MLNISIASPHKQSTNNLNGSLLTFNKQKRSSSIDNVISAFTSTSQQLGNKIYSNNNNSNAHNKSEKTPAFSNSRSINSKINNNLFLSGTDLKDLLETFNINTNKLGGEANRSINPEDSNHTNRSRSLHRDGSSIQNNSSYYLDINNRRKLMNDSNVQKLKSNDLNSSSNFSGYNNNNNQSNLSNRNQYEIISQPNMKYDDSNQNVLYNSNDLNSSSHVVPKPPPGNPQRNTNLYPAAR